MTKQEFENLMTGDVVRHKIGGDSVVVTANCGGRVTFDITNPDEWEVLYKTPAFHVQRIMQLVCDNPTFFNREGDENPLKAAVDKLEALVTDHNE